MARGVNIHRILCATAGGIASLMALVFLLDLAIAIPFGRFSIWTDLCVLIAAGLVVWQTIETWQEL